MWTFVLSCSVAITVLRPVTVADNQRFIAESRAPSFGNKLRGMMLAAAIKQGMTRDQVRRILGVPRSRAFNLRIELHSYDPLDVSVLFQPHNSVLRVSAPTISDLASDLAISFWRYCFPWPHRTKTSPSRN
jgi:hypothetical protein